MRFNTLTPIEQKRLLRRARKGDIQARKELGECFIPLVMSIVGKMRAKQGVSIEDLQQEGHVSVQRALDRYKLRSPMKLHNYVAMWVEGAIIRHLRKARSVVKQDYGNVTAIQDFALDVPMRVEDSDGETWLEHLRSEGPGPEESVIAADEVARTTMALSQAVKNFPLRIPESLPQNSQGVTRAKAISILSDLVQNRLYTDEPQSLDDISRRHGVGRETIRKMEMKLLAKVRAVL